MIVIGVISSTLKTLFTGHNIVCSGLPFESRCFGHYWYIHFLVPSKTSWNSASEDPKIMHQGQIKDQIKGQESSSLWLPQNNWFHKSKIVEAFQRMSFFSTREWMFCAKQLLLCGKNMWWVIKASSNGSFFVTFLLCFFTFEGQRGDFFEIFLHKRTKKL